MLLKGNSVFLKCTFLEHCIFNVFIIITIITTAIAIIIIIIIIISNINWTSCRTIQGVIERVIPKLDEREAFEITSTITP